MDFKSLSKNEQGALIAGAIALLFSFFGNYVNLSIKGGAAAGISGGGGVTSAWTGLGTLGMLLLIVAAAVVALKAFAKDTLPDGVPWNLVAFGAAALGTLLVIIRAFTAGESVSGFSYSPGWSAYVLFAAAAALTYFTFTLFKASGDKMPEFNKKDTPPAA